MDFDRDRPGYVVSDRRFVSREAMLDIGRDRRQQQILEDYSPLPKDRKPTLVEVLTKRQDYHYRRMQEVATELDKVKEALEYLRKHPEAEGILEWVLEEKNSFYRGWFK